MTHSVSMHLLIIEDDLNLGLALQRALKAEGFSSEWLRRSADIPHRIDESSYSCILLDLTLPDGSGFDLLRRWRTSGIAIPIIVITARTALEDRLLGLDGGADDFVIKPFATAELVSRIHAVMRRFSRQASEVWELGALSIEPRRHSVTLDGMAVDLSPREYQLLLELARQPEIVLAKAALAQRLEPLGDPLEFGALEVHISNLRRKIGAERIRTVRGVGYMLKT